MINQIKTIVFLGALSTILVGLGGYLAPGYIYFFGALAICLNFGAYFWSDKIVLKMHRASEVSKNQAPWLHNIVENLAKEANIPKPKIYVISEAQPNAFATGRNPEHGVVAVTEGIVDLLTERELSGVIAHELAHIKNRDILISTIAAVMASAVTFIANIMQISAIFGGTRDDDEGGSPLGMFALAFLAPIAATLVQLGISRSREYHADAIAAQINGDPEALASALEKLNYSSKTIPSHVQPATASLFIVNPLYGQKSFLNLFSTHPPVQERVKKLRNMKIQ